VCVEQWLMPEDSMVFAARNVLLQTPTSLTYEWYYMASSQTGSNSSGERTSWLINGRKDTWWSDFDTMVTWQITSLGRHCVGSRTHSHICTTQQSRRVQQQIPRQITKCQSMHTWRGDLSHSCADCSGDRTEDLGTHRLSNFSKI